MKFQRPWLAGAVGGSLLVGGCGGGPDPNAPGADTAQHVNAPQSDGTVSVTSEEVGLQDGDLFLLATSSPFTGLVNDAWPNGNKKYQCAYTNGKKDGAELSWHENGQRQMSAQFTTGVQQGMGQEWWPNGNQRSITTYVDGKPNGEAKGWHDNGKPARVINFANGVPTGKSEGWWKNGQRAEVIQYANGKPDGEVSKWHPNGAKAMTVTFVNNQKQGEAWEWHPNGKQKSKEIYANGIAQGTHNGWREDGSALWQSMWKDGVRHGTCTVWYANGKPKLAEVYNGGVMVRQVKYNENGQLTLDYQVPPGKTRVWTEDQLQILQGSKAQTQATFGRPDKAAGNAWFYNGLLVMRQNKRTKVNIRIMFDPTGENSMLELLNSNPTP